MKSKFVGEITILWLDRLSRMEAKEIPCKIGLPHYLTPQRGDARAVVNRLPFGLDRFGVHESCAFNNPLPNVGVDSTLESSNSLVIVGVGK